MKNLDVARQQSRILKMFGMICYGKKIFVETITMVNEQREKKQKQMIDIVYVASRDRH